METYQKEQDKKNIKKIREHISFFPEWTHDFFTFYLSVKKASTRTVLNYCYDVETFFYFVQKKKDLSLAEITPQIIDDLTVLDIQKYIDFLTLYEKDGKEYTNDACGQSRKLSSLRSFYKYFQNIRIMKNNPASLIPFPKKREKGIIKLEKDEVTTVLQSAHAGISLTEQQQKYAEKSKYRDIAIITFFLGTGVRVSELVGLNLKDINYDNSSAHILRKGNKESFVYFNTDVKDALLDYVNLERNTTPIAEGNEDALFISRKGYRLSVRSVERIVKKYTQNIITDKKISPHKLRSTYGTNLYRESNDIYLTADALGHKNLSVTAKHYADMGDDRRKEAVSYTNAWLSEESSESKKN